METLIKEKFYDALVQNNPDVLVKLQGEQAVTKYIDGMYDAKRIAIELILSSDHQPNEKQEEVLNTLLGELVPSRFHYVRDLLAKNYKEKFEEFAQLGMINTIVISLIEFCGKIFENHNFNSMTEDSAWLQFEILASMEEYLSTE